MVAIHDISGIYHLLESKTRTLCGVHVAPVKLPRKLNVPVMHLVETPPERFRLCKHCKKLETDTTAVPET